jgi:hypothetical protein
VAGQRRRLSVAFGLLFLAALVGQAIAGHADHNHRQVPGAAQLSPLCGWWRGSPESKPPDQIGHESDEKQKVGRHATAESPKWARAGGWRTALFSRSPGLTMAALFLLSWLAQSIAGLSAYNAEQLSQLADPLTWLQNWQSELLAIGSMAVLSAYFRHRGSPESRPVGTAHGGTEKSG